jgi:YD repeat-containing protein
MTMKVDGEPLEEYDMNGKQTYRRYSDGFEAWRQYDEQGNMVYYRNSDGYEVWREFDAHGKLINTFHTRKTRQTTLTPTEAPMSKTFEVTVRVKLEADNQYAAWLKVHDLMSHVQSVGMMSYVQSVDTVKDNTDA